MRGLGDKLKTVEDQLSEAMFQNQEKDRIILEKDDQLKEKQNKIYRMTDELSNRDEKIEKQETTINNLKYKMKDDAERFEVRLELSKEFIRQTVDKKCPLRKCHVSIGSINCYKFKQIFIF